MTSRTRFDMTGGALRAVVFLFAFSLILAAANLVFTARQVNSVRAVEATAAANTASITQLCQAGNVSRAQQVALWDHVLIVSANSPPPLHETPARKRQRLATARAFEAYVHKVFAPRDCTAH